MVMERELPNEIYIDPLATRYADDEMLYLFSPLNKFRTWRKLWIAMAEAQKDLGLKITDEQIKEMKDNQENINFTDADRKEEEIRHDVMAHIYAYGLQCPKAKPIIHLGATSAYVGDNTDLILMREGMKIIRLKLVNVIDKLAGFAEDYKSTPTLSFTHLQPAQPTTIGKRACLWINDLIMDFERIEFEIGSMKFLGVKGTTGTQDSYLKLFDGDHDKVVKLDELVAKKMGFKEIYDVTGQTYPRKLDSIILGVLCNIAQSAHKFANDIRILQHLKEMEEPFDKSQIGSSAMAYKKNPIRCERMTSLARFVITLQQSAYFNACAQFLERTLDDSANRRLIIPMAFLAMDGVLNIFLDTSWGLKVYTKAIDTHLMKELPFLATEEILIEGVKAGGDRQLLHERVRVHSMEARKRIYDEGKDNDLIERLTKDSAFSIIKKDIKSLLKPERFIGRAKEQVEEFLHDKVKPIRDRYKEKLGKRYKVKL